MRGGKAWFAIEAKSFKICVEEVGKRLKSCIRERSKGFTLWVRFGNYTLQCLLVGVEDCERMNRNGSWSLAWEEEGKKYKMERRSNKVGSFLLCSVRDAGRKSFSIAVPKGRGMLGGWHLFLGKLCNLGVEPKWGRSSGSPTRVVAKESRLSDTEAKLFVEVLRLEIVSRGVEVWFKVEENEVVDSLGHMDYCLVGW